MEGFINQFTEFFGGTSTGTVELGNSWQDMVVRLIVGLILGLVLAFSYMLCNKKSYSRTMAISMVVLPTLVASVIWMIGSDLTKAISLGGLFTLIKFRSVAGDSKDIMNVLLAMSVGLAVGLGVYPVAIILTVVMVLVLIALSLSSFAKKPMVDKTLKITVSESLNFEGVFDEVLPSFTDAFKLENIKTTHMGTMFELTYSVALKKDISTKGMIDELRTRNGNLPIILSSKAYDKAPTQL